MKNRLISLLLKFIRYKRISYFRDKVVEPMNNVPVIIESLCYLLSKLKQADKVHLLKLMYLADKYHLMNYGRTVTGDQYFAFEYGPGGSQTLDTLDFDRYVLGDCIDKAGRLLKTRGGFEFFPGDECATDQLDMLSETDIEALDFAVINFGSKDKWNVVDYTHELLEWKRFEPLFKAHSTKREPIAIEDVLISPNDEYFSVSKEHLEDSRKILNGSFD